MSESGREHLVVAIIGGGYCGTMTAVHLLSQTEFPMEVVMVNFGYPLNKGVAYSSYSHQHLLNVRAQDMSAFPDKPDDFVEWVRTREKHTIKDKSELPVMFLPRNIYGYYLKNIFENAMRCKPMNVSVSFVHDEAIDMEMKSEGMYIYFSVSPAVIADRVVLATGNQLPANPAAEGDLHTSKYYFRNPWLHEAVNNLDPDQEVLVIGNGLTMADVVIGLKEKGHAGKIYALSPHGFELVPHRVKEPYTKLLEELEPPYQLKKIVRLFSKHIHERGAKGDAIIDSLRPMIQEIWMSWKPDEKRWFLEHLRHLWDVARHRLPANIYNQIQNFIINDELEIIAGRLLEAKEHGDGITARVIRRKNQKEHELKVGRVINCTGPVIDINKVERPLFQNLISRKLIRADELKIGIHAKPDGTVIHADGTESSRLLSIGSSLKGVLWESTAVPELRLQAKNIAEKIIKESKDLKTVQR